MKFLYDLAIIIYGFLIRLGSLGVPKAKDWVRGRKNWRQRLQSQMKTDKKVIWFHCASLGEFEQGRPLIELVRKNHPDYFILLTFFSPSGYIPKQKFEHADAIAYLPLDTHRNAVDFVSIVNPDLVIFVKYEFWVNHLNQCFKKDIPVVLISSVFRPVHSYFKWHGKVILRAIRQFDMIFVQDQASKDVLEHHGIDANVTGDTRIDRVIDISNNPLELSEIRDFVDKPTIVFGSIWQQDEHLMLPFIRENKGRYKFIIAPHDVHKSIVDRYLSIFEGRSISYKWIDKNRTSDHDVLVIDRIGLLSSIYQFAHIAYIGGAFGHGLHNILEPTAHGVPVIFGPKHHKFPEAAALIELGGAYSVTDTEAFNKAVNRIEASYEGHQEALRSFYDQHRGATGRVYRYLQDNDRLP